MAIKTPCPLCGGSGKVAGFKCRLCKGKKFIWK